jgi:hypothetical protein
MPQDFRYSSAYFKGEILDVTHRILRLVTSKWVEREVRVNLCKFISLVDHWMHLVYNKIGNTPKCPGRFGSLVIDLLEIIPECKKDITVIMDSSGWCCIRGEYEVQAKFEPALPDCASELEPLTVKQQAPLESVLFHYARMQCIFHFFELDYRTVYGNHFPRWDHVVEYVMCQTNDASLTFKVDLKCRKELLLELFNEQSYECAPGAHTAEDPNPNLQLKLQIERKFLAVVTSYNF